MVLNDKTLNIDEHTSGKITDEDILEKNIC